MSADFYRAEALAMQRSIDDLPRTVKVASGTMRAATVTLSASLLLGFALSAIVQIPISVAGGGMVVDGSGELLRAANATAAGFVERLFVKVGDPVTTGQPLAQLSLPEMRDNILKARQVLDGAIGDNDRQTSLDGTDESSEAASRAVKVAGMTAEIARMERRLQWLRQQESSQETLAAGGLTTGDRVLSARVATQQLLDQMDKIRDDRASLQVQISESSHRRARARLTREQDIADKRAALLALEADHASRSILRSPATGRVAELGADVGASVMPGQVVLTVLPLDSGPGNLRAIVYLPMAQGKRVTAGDPVLLLPDSLREAAHDRLKGHVLGVSRTPATQAAITSQLGSQQLFRLLTKDGPVFAATVALDADPAAPGALVWASGHGPAGFALERGTALSADVTVERTSLMSLILPSLRRLIDPDPDPWKRDPTS